METKGKKSRHIEKTPAEILHPIEKKQRVVIEDTAPSQVKEWVIYLWRDDDKYFACAKVKGQLYGQGWKIEKDILNKDSESREHWQARRNAVVPVDNTLNVLAMYDRKATDSNGNIVWKQVQFQERLHSWFRALRKTRKFPIVEITAQEAFKMKLT